MLFVSVWLLLLLLLEDHKTSTGGTDAMLGASAWWGCWKSVDGGCGFGLFCGCFTIGTW